MKYYDCIVIGGGQSALACGYYLRRTDLKHVLLDENDYPGGAWSNGWDSLTLFSPAEHSSLPGWQMPKSEGEFPSRDEVIEYLIQYEERYHIPVKRGVTVQSIEKGEEDTFVVKTNQGKFRANRIIAATGTYKAPFIPEISGLKDFEGISLHSAAYKNATVFKNQSVLIVGEGNSGAQILAEVSKVAATFWATRKDPEYLPDDVDGRVLFDSASAIYYAKQEGKVLDVAKINLGNIVMIPPVKKARERGVLKRTGALSAFEKSHVVWEDGQITRVDAVIWCTGFHNNTKYLKELVSLDEKGKILTDGTRSIDEPNLWLVGFGGWTGFASATLIGVGRSARHTIKEIEASFQK